jgi:hypothetical protein
VGYAESLGTKDETRLRARGAAEALAKLTSLVTPEKRRSAYEEIKLVQKATGYEKQNEAHHRGLGGCARSALTTPFDGISYPQIPLAMH